MKTVDKAFEIAKEVAKVLSHNKHLIDREEELAVVIGARFATPMRESYDEGVKDGKDGIMVNDLIPLAPETPSGKTWN